MMLVLRTNDVAYGSDAHGVNDAALRTNDVTLNGELASITASSIIMSAANNIILTSSKHHCEQPRVTSLSLCENITASKREQHHFRSAKTSLRATASNITFALRKLKIIQFLCGYTIIFFGHLFEAAGSDEADFSNLQALDILDLLNLVIHLFCADG